MDPSQERKCVGSTDLVSHPRRIQLSRKKGWRKPPNTVNVARPSKWGNPWRVGKEVDTAENAVKWYQWSMEADDSNLRSIRRELHGKNLACWCPLNTPCHADVLLRLANSGNGTK